MFTFSYAKRSQRHIRLALGMPLLASGDNLVDLIEHRQSLLALLQQTEAWNTR